MSLMDERRAAANRELVLLLALIAVFHLGWIKFVLPDRLYEIDYAERILVICLFLLIAGVPDFRPKRLLWTAIAVVVTVVAMRLSGVFLDHILFGIWPEHVRLGGFWRIQDPVHRLFDLTAGLALVAVSEELVYRRLVHDQLERLNRNPWFIYVLSALVFAELHAAQGPAVFAGAFYAGLGLMYLYRIGRSLLAPVIAHYLLNLWIIHDSAVAAQASGWRIWV